MAYVGLRYLRSTKYYDITRASVDVSFHLETMLSTSTYVVRIIMVLVSGGSLNVLRTFTGNTITDSADDPQLCDRSLPYPGRVAPA
jgi:hypothetical protein